MKNEKKESQKRPFFDDPELKQFAKRVDTQEWDTDKQKYKYSISEVNTIGKDIVEEVKKNS